MKFIEKKILVFFICCSLIFTISCEKEESIEEVNGAIKKGKTTYVNIDEVPFLIPTLQKYKQKSTSTTNNKDGDLIQSEILNLDLENILKYVAPDGKETYSIVVKEEFAEFENLYFENVHIWQEQGVFKSVILKYDSIDDYEKFDPLEFTGIVEILDMEGIYQGEAEVLKGEVTHVKVDIGCWHIVAFSDGNLGIRYDCLQGAGGGPVPGGTSSGTGSSPNLPPTQPGGSSNIVVANVPVWSDPEGTTVFNMARLLRIELDLETSDQVWLRNSPNITFEAYNYLFETFYLNDNIEDNEARLFTKSTLLSLIGSSAILDTSNFDDNITTNLPPCLTSVITDLKSLQNGKFGQVIAQFAGSNPLPQNFNWTVNSASLGPNVIAQTNPTIQNGTATTTINSDFTSISTDLSIAKTLIHECFHAYLNSVYRFRTIDVGYVNLINQYSTQFNNANDIHHHFYTINNIVTEISLALKEYGTLKGYNLPQQFYDDMAWGGLYGTQAYNALPQSQRERIESTIDAEFTNSSSGPANVVGITPNGVQICP